MIVLLRTERLTLSLKGRGWAVWHHSNEAGLRVVQAGPLVLELAV